MGYWKDSTIDAAEAVDDSEETIDVSADPTTLIPTGSTIKIDTEEMAVTGGSSGGATKSLLMGML